MHVSTGCHAGTFANFEGRSSGGEGLLRFLIPRPFPPPTAQPCWMIPFWLGCARTHSPLLAQSPGRKPSSVAMGDEELSHLTLEEFEPSLGEGAVTRANVAEAVIAGCRRKLLGERQEELEALRRGFNFDSRMDLAMHFARS